MSLLSKHFGSCSSGCCSTLLLSAVHVYVLLKFPYPYLTIAKHRLRPMHKHASKDAAAGMLTLKQAAYLSTMDTILTPAG